MSRGALRASRGRAGDPNLPINLTLRDSSFGHEQPPQSQPSASFSSHEYKPFSSSAHWSVPWWWLLRTTSDEKGTWRVASDAKMRSPKSTVVDESTSMGRRAAARTWAQQLNKSYKS